MSDTIKNFLGLGAKVHYAELVKQGATILDVRRKDEYEGGHIRGSINIPVDTLSSSLSKLNDKNKPVIICCASGIRSASAKSILLASGYKEVYNGGSWNSLQNQLG